MTDTIAALAEISGRYDALFCDLWGCLHNGKTPFPAAVAALRAFRARGGSVVLMTNAPRPSQYVIRQLQGMGVPDDAWDLVVSSGDAAQDAMFAGAVGRRVYHLGPSKDDGFFTDIPDHHRSAPPVERVPLDQAEGIVCTGPFDELTETPEDYRANFLFAKARGLKLLCANPDIVVDLGDRRIYCAGALAQAYDAMGGESLYYGKPHPPIYDLARRRLADLRGHQIEHAGFLAVGDGYDTDIRGAMAEGIDSLFVTGGIFAEAFGPDPDAPDPGKLRDWIAGKDVAPTFAIPKLR
ncbi:MAG: hypothetical protein RLZZ528_176 [Pseudomonadota bacterium]